MKQFTTPNGTVLSMMNLKGKDYMGVQQRIVWFKEERPTWSIETEFKVVTQELAIAKATIRDDTGRIMATAHKQETAKGFADFIEKSETGAIGRALLLCGFGTAFAADDFHEGERLADSPQPPKDKDPVVPKFDANAPITAETIVGWSKKFKGKKLGDVKADFDFHEMCDWAINGFDCPLAERDPKVKQYMFEDAKRWLKWING